MNAPVDVVDALLAAAVPQSVAVPVAAWVGSPTAQAAHVVVHDATMDALFVVPGGLVQVQYSTHATVEAIPWSAVTRVAMEIDRPTEDGPVSQLAIELAGGTRTVSGNFAAAPRHVNDQDVHEGLLKMDDTPAGWLRTGSAADISQLAAAIRHHLLV